MCGDGDHPTAVAAGDKTADVKYLKDYKKPNYLVDNIHLEFRLDNAGLGTLVNSKLTVRADCPPGTPLVLDGKLLELLPYTLKIDGKLLPPNWYTIDQTKGTLTISAEAIPTTNEPFVLQASVRIKPVENTALEGLYMSSDTYCTQCEGKCFIRAHFFYHSSLTMR